jgi:hypothetical protein
MFHSHFGRILGYPIGGTDELERLYNLLIKRAKVDQTLARLRQQHWRVKSGSTEGLSLWSSSCARSLSHDRLVLPQRDPFDSFPNLRSG